MNRAVISSSPHSRYPVIEGDPDKMIGIVHVRDLFLACDAGKPIDLRALARPELAVPELTPALDMLEQFQASGERMALVVDEYGSVQGIVTWTDLVEPVVGDLRGPGEAARPSIVRREDGSWLVDGSLHISDLLDELGLRELPGEENEGFTTVAGFFLAHLHRIPEPGDDFTIDGWRFEVVDMDGNRIDKVLISKQPSTPETE